MLVRKPGSAWRHTGRMFRWGGEYKGDAAAGDESDARVAFRMNMILDRASRICGGNIVRTVKVLRVSTQCDQATGQRRTYRADSTVRAFALQCRSFCLAWLKVLQYIGSVSDTRLRNSRNRLASAFTLTTVSRSQPAIMQVHPHAGGCGHPCMKPFHCTQKNDERTERKKEKKRSWDASRKALHSRKRDLTYHDELKRPIL